MAKMTIGSGQPSKKTEQVNNVFNRYDDSELKLKIENLKSIVEELYSRAPQIIENHTVETVIEKQPEIHQHVYPVQEAKDLDLSHLVPVERYEAEYKMFSQVTNKKLEEVAQDYNNVNQRIDEILENQQKDENSLNDFKKAVEHDIVNLFKQKDSLSYNIIQIEKDIQITKDQIGTQQALVNDSRHESYSLKNYVSNLHTAVDLRSEELKRNLKIQTIINILLTVGLVISLFR
jgi:septal ring factor EnvC (AmiA/AmiB activator)